MLKNENKLITFVPDLENPTKIQAEPKLRPITGKFFLNQLYNRLEYPFELEDDEPDDEIVGGGVNGLGATLAAFAACFNFGTFPRPDIFMLSFLGE